MFAKVDIPADDGDRSAFAKKLMKYVSILDYTHALKQPEIRYAFKINPGDKSN